MQNEEPDILVSLGKLAGEMLILAFRILEIATVAWFTAKVAYPWMVGK